MRDRTSLPFYERAADFLTDRVASRLVIGRGPRNQPSRAELESLAQQEIQARIDLGRPGPEEAVRRDAVPDWAEPQPARSSRPLDAVQVRLDVLGVGAAPTPEVAAPAGSAAANPEPVNR